MKIYISADMEGAWGIGCKAQTDKKSSMYKKGAEYLTEDVNAAIDGAFAGGADEVIVADMHNGSFNINYDEIDARAQIVAGFPHKAARFPYLDNSVDGMFLVAYHSMAGTLWGTLEHTFTSLGWHRVEINGQPVGETAIDGAIAGDSGVPVVMVSGDDKLCNEAEALIEGVSSACVKHGLGRERTMFLPRDIARENIWNAAKRGVSLVNTIKPVIFESPVEIKIVNKHTSGADGSPISNGMDAVRIDGYTQIYRFDKVSDWFGGTWQENTERINK